MSFTGVTSKDLPQSSYCKNVGRTVIFNNNHAPANEAKIAGIPNRNKTALSVFLPTNAILKRLFEKCTTPVSAMAISIGKNIAKIGCMVAFGVVGLNVKMVLLKMFIPELYWSNFLVLFKEFNKV